MEYGKNWMPTSAFTPVHKFGNKNPSRPPFGKGRRTPLWKRGAGEI